MNSLVHKNSCSLDFQETSTHSLPVPLFCFSSSLREIEDKPCRPCICEEKLSSIKVILLNTNGNEFTNFSSVSFNTFEAQKWNRRGCIHWHLHFAKLTIVIKAAYLRTNGKELLPQKRFFARQYTAGTLSSTLIFDSDLCKRYIAVGEANGKSSTFTLENNRLHTDCVGSVGCYQTPHRRS